MKQKTSIAIFKIKFNFLNTVSSDLQQNRKFMIKNLESDDNVLMFIFQR